MASGQSAESVYLVIDELHSYRGTCTEISYTIRAFLDRIGLTRITHNCKLSRRLRPCLPQTDSLFGRLFWSRHKTPPVEVIDGTTQKPVPDARKRSSDFKGNSHRYESRTSTIPMSNAWHAQWQLSSSFPRRMPPRFLTRSDFMMRCSCGDGSQMAHAASKRLTSCPLSLEDIAPDFLIEMWRLPRDIWHA